MEKISWMKRQKVLSGKKIKQEVWQKIWQHMARKYCRKMLQENMAIHWQENMVRKFGINMARNFDKEDFLGGAVKGKLFPLEKGGASSFSPKKC